MASSQLEGSDVQLKHLGLVRVLAVNAVVLISILYDSAKQNSGPLKSTVGIVENAVTSVVGPVYERLKGVPGDLLVFLDKKVDEAANKFDECAPPAAKDAVSKAQLIVKKATNLAADLLEEAKVAGPFAAASHAGKISKNIAVNLLAILWYKANKYPAFHSVSELAVPTAAHWSEKYNNIVKDMTTKGYTLFSYFPLVPVEDITRAYKQAESAAGKKADAGTSSESESDKE